MNVFHKGVFFEFYENKLQYFALHIKLMFMYLSDFYANN